ncbi:MAG: hypothetical protein K2V38_14400 [Gemmataceae bacterium]|nr:hypothetical protein [Gemmataceae bacterium]
MIYRISASPSDLNSLFDLVPVPAGQTSTLLQWAADDTSTPSVSEWNLYCEGSRAVRVELVEVDQPATVIPLTESQVTPADGEATKAEPGTRFALHDQGTGYSATAEGEVGYLRLLDAAVVEPGKPLVRKFDKPPKMHPRRVLQLRVATNGQDTLATASLTLSF